MTQFSILLAFANERFSGDFIEENKKEGSVAGEGYDPNGSEAFRPFIAIFGYNRV